MSAHATLLVGVHLRMRRHTAGSRDRLSPTPASLATSIECIFQFLLLPLQFALLLLSSCCFSVCLLRWSFSFSMYNLPSLFFIDNGHWVSVYSSLFLFGSFCYHVHGPQRISLSLSLSLNPAAACSPPVLACGAGAAALPLRSSSFLVRGSFHFSLTHFFALRILPDVVSVFLSCSVSLLRISWLYFTGFPDARCGCIEKQ